jgi:hypothetical protein
MNQEIRLRRIRYLHPSYFGNALQYAKSPFAVIRLTLINKLSAASFWADDFKVEVSYVTRSRDPEHGNMFLRVQ